MTADVWSWVLTGAVTSLLAPIVLLALRRWPPVVSLRVPAVPAAVGFVVVHGAVTAALVAELGVGAGAWLLLHVVLLAAAVVFWQPVLGPQRLPGGPCALYLFLSAPALDLAAIGVIVAGDGLGGLAMLIAMLPITVAAVTLTWRWIVAEERAAVATDQADPAGRAGPGPRRAT